MRPTQRYPLEFFAYPLRYLKAVSGRALRNPFAGVDVARAWCLLRLLETRYNGAARDARRPEGPRIRAKCVNKTDSKWIHQAGVSGSEGQHKGGL